MYDCTIAALVPARSRIDDCSSNLVAVEGKQRGGGGGGGGVLVLVDDRSSHLLAVSTVLVEATGQTGRRGRRRRRRRVRRRRG